MERRALAEELRVAREEAAALGGAGEGAGAPEARAPPGVAERGRERGREGQADDQVHVPRVQDAEVIRRGRKPFASHKISFSKFPRKYCISIDSPRSVALTRRRAVARASGDVLRGGPRRPRGCARGRGRRRRRAERVRSLRRRHVDPDDRGRARGRRRARRPRGFPRALGEGRDADPAHDVRERRRTRRLPPLPPRAQAQGGEGAQDAAGLPGLARGERRGRHPGRTARPGGVQDERADVSGVVSRPRRPRPAGVHRAHGQRQVRGPRQEARPRRLRQDAPARHGVPIPRPPPGRQRRRRDARVQDVQRHRRRRTVPLRHRVPLGGAGGVEEDRADRPGLLPGEPGRDARGARAVEFHHRVEHRQGVPGREDRRQVQGARHRRRRGGEADEGARRGRVPAFLGGTCACAGGCVCCDPRVGETPDVLTTEQVAYARFRGAATTRGGGGGLRFR